MAGKTLALINHAQTRNVQEALACLNDNECDVDHKDEHGCTALHYAASNGLDDLIAKVDEKKTNFNLINKISSSDILGVMDYHNIETEILIQSQKVYGYRCFHIRREDLMTEPTGTVTNEKQVALRQDEVTSETRRSFVGRVWEKCIRKFKGNKADTPRRRNFRYQENTPPLQRVNEIVSKRKKIVQIFSKRKKTLKYLYVEAEDADPTDPECTINVLRLSSLEKIGGLLTDDECHKLGLKLRLNSRNLDKSSKRFKIDMFTQWRGNRPHNALVTTLIDALESIDKGIIGKIVQEAIDRKTEFNYIYE